MFREYIVGQIKRQIKYVNAFHLLESVEKSSIFFFRATVMIPSPLLFDISNFLYILLVLYILLDDFEKRMKKMSKGIKLSFYYPLHPYIKIFYKKVLRKFY